MIGTALLVGIASPAAAFEFKGFGDITYTKSDAIMSAHHHGSVSLGQLDLYVSERISERIEFLSEIVIEGEMDGGVFIEPERLQISYLLYDWLKVHAGRFHNVLGYWNTAFHHGRQIQTTIERPQIVKFEDQGGILPVHLVGLSLSGYFPAGGLQLHYDAMVGNGPKIVGVGGSNQALDPNPISDNSGNKAVAVHLSVRPTSLPDLAVGVCGNLSQVEGFDTSTPSPVRVTNVSQLILCGDLVYISEIIEFLSEYYAIFDRDRMASGHYLNHGAYLQAAYTIATRYIPYVRYEWISVDEADPYFAALAAVDTSKTIGGFRYNLAKGSAIKAEYRHVRRPGIENADEVALQWTFWF